MVTGPAKTKHICTKKHMFRKQSVSWSLFMNTYSVNFICFLIDSLMQHESFSNMA